MLKIKTLTMWAFNGTLMNFYNEPLHSFPKWIRTSCRLCFTIILRDGLMSIQRRDLKMFCCSFTDGWLFQCLKYLIKKTFMFLVFQYSLPKVKYCFHIVNVSIPLNKYSLDVFYGCFHLTVVWKSSLPWDKLEKRKKPLGTRSGL